MFRRRLVPRTAIGVGLAIAGAGLVLSGGSRVDPQTPPSLPGKPPPFLGSAVVGNGGLTAAVDAYGSVVDLRAPGPAGEGLIENGSDRQAAGSVPADTGIVLRMAVGGGPGRPPWQMDSIRQRYLPGTNVLRTVARTGEARIELTDAARSETLVRRIDVHAPPRVPLELTVRSNIRQGRGGIRCKHFAGSDARRGEAGERDSAVSRPRWSVRGHGRLRSLLICSPSLGEVASERTAAGIASTTIRAAARADRRWLNHSPELGRSAPSWARRMYRRSLLALRALTDRRTGAAAAGARDGWAYVWPRDAGAVAIALAATGHRNEARRACRFLVGLDLGSAARFRGTGEPVGGRSAQGDARGWVEAAARAAGYPAPTGEPDQRRPGQVGQAKPRRPGAAGQGWRNRADYQEGGAGDYLGNAIAAVTSGTGGPEELRALFATPEGLAREARGPASGLDSAAAWAVRPFPHPALFPLVRRTLLGLAARGSRFGLVPSEGWPGHDPWTAPTAWSAWSLAALGRGNDAPGTAPRGARWDALRAPSAERAARRARRAARRLLGALRRAATPTGLLPERVDARTGVARSTTPLAWAHAFAILALRELWPGRGSAAGQRPAPLSDGSQGGGDGLFGG